MNQQVLILIWYHAVIGDLMNIILEAIMVFVFHMGVTGAATAHVISQ
jgi:Na+-driven multidrug efflux pump